MGKINELQEINQCMVDRDDALERSLLHDGVVYYPLGGGAYTFKKNYVDYLLKQIDTHEVRISIGAQPNSSPHLGTLAVFNLAYALGYKMSVRSGFIKPEIFFEVVDTAPFETRTIEGVDYQISLRESKVADKYLEEYFEVLELLKRFTDIDYTVRRQKDFNLQPGIQRILRSVIGNRETIATILDPERGILKMRVACTACGLTDKDGVNNKYHGDSMESYCPEHGWFETSFEHEPERFEYNTPLRNLIRAIAYARDNQNEDIPFTWFRVTGSDYAGYYQEQLLYKAASTLGTPAHELPPIIYTPLITDWSGAKLSKSLYLKENAYKYLPPYLVEYAQFREQLGEQGMRKLFEEVSSWLDESHKLFRNYSVYYFMGLFGNE
ncbi:hypothetical protein HZB02_05910 [Candidatus Woesearchaeota archaeon]|nr:hypothetical protein [Candidatus Woesearchaeota archaeon]